MSLSPVQGAVIEVVARRMGDSNDPSTTSVLGDIIREYGLDNVVDDNLVHRQSQDNPEGSEFHTLQPAQIDPQQVRIRVRVVTH